MNPHQNAIRHFERIVRNQQHSWPDKEWCGNDIITCNVCSRPMQSETWMINGAIQCNPFPTQGIMCVLCGRVFCADIQWKKGQLYKKSANGIWMLMAGGPPPD